MNHFKPLSLLTFMLLGVFVPWNHTVFAACPSFDTYPDVITPTCGSPAPVLTSTNLPNWPTSGIQELAIFFLITKDTTTSCAGAAPNTDLHFKFMHQSTVVAQIVYDGWYNAKINGQWVLSGARMKHPVWFVVTASLNTGQVFIHIWGGDYPKPAPTLTGTIPTGGTFDSNTKICFLGDCSTVKYSAFSIRDIRVEYKFYSDTDVGLVGIFMRMKDKHEMVADYRMTEGSGYTITNSATSSLALGPGYLGDSTPGTPSSNNAPAWLTPVGLSFTTTSQKITLPSTIQSVFQDYFINSITISFQVKVTSMGSQKLISRTKLDNGNIFSVELNSANSLVIKNLDQSQTSATCRVMPNTWTTITVHFETIDYISNGGYYIIPGNSMYMNDISCLAPDQLAIATTLLTVEASTDIFKIGGFKGTINNLKIFWKGSGRLESCGSTCKYDTGKAGEACLQDLCGYDNCFTCGETGCLACETNYGLYALDKKCYDTCPSGSYKSEGDCVACPTANCDKCDATGCITCQNNHMFYATQKKCYDTCPSGSYKSGDNCVACPTANCDTCDAAGCITCKTNYGLYALDKKCYDTCPTETYKSGANCFDCSTIPNCDLCNFSGCETCKSGYLLYRGDGKCYAQRFCPPGTYPSIQECLDAVSSPSAESSSSGLTTGVIVGISIAASGVGLFVVFTAVKCIMLKKSHRIARQIRPTKVSIQNTKLRLTSELSPISSPPLNP